MLQVINIHLNSLYIRHLNINVVPRAGVEPTTLSLGRICSIQLSYRGASLLYLRGVNSSQEYDREQSLLGRFRNQGRSRLC